MNEHQRSDRRITQEQRKGRGSNPRSHENLRPFQPGESGNPSGLSRGVPKVGVALMNLLRGDADNSYQPKTRAEKLAWALYEKALKGDVPAIREIIDRCEGRTPQTLNLNHDDARADRFRQMAIDLATRYSKPLQQVIADLVAQNPEAAPFLQDWPKEAAVPQIAR